MILYIVIYLVIQLIWIVILGWGYIKLYGKNKIHMIIRIVIHLVLHKVIHTIDIILIHIIINI